MSDHHNLPAPGVRFIVAPAGNRWVVLDPDFQRVFGPVGRRAAAVAARDRLQAEDDARKRRGMRPCLTCRAPFWSEGPHNRMCGRCRGKGDPLDGAGFELDGRVRARKGV